MGRSTRPQRRRHRHRPVHSSEVPPARASTHSLGVVIAIAAVLFTLPLLLTNVQPSSDGLRGRRELRKF
ncbi:hypothetical protein KBY97_01205 [Synechococcus sp. ATX 2A4]|uniref:hypothetical protein n=1 Tax=Synechococcus sp. ATX 2A4 TaxID=2823727 RepID=UPI0020CD0C4D|nr:hypothetical protein [Synechococcus sp. ATX 2A4]MCP9883746.1 hypothetical protein [Synechococcus sp. ATX 2A4]